MAEKLPPRPKNRKIIAVFFFNFSRRVTGFEISININIYFEVAPYSSNGSLYGGFWVLARAQEAQEIQEFIPRRWFC